ncbi:MAG: RICIN domain-containing protein [Methylorubrum rhodinum]|uniref:RICIN domain-containing protein n=1 Tax=Methylorubrum rhodinum TaxID=29428 RepID=UPI003BAE813A
MTRRNVADSRARARRTALLSATMLATGFLNPAQAAKFGIVVDAVQDPLLANLAIPDSAPTMGMWSGVRDWPMNAIHMGLLPSGKVVSFGTAAGNPGVQDGRTFDIWNPYAGLAAGSHVNLPGITRINSFCAAQAFQADGSLLVSGGIFDNGNDKGSVVLNTAANGVSAIGAQLANDRYYSTMLTLPNGQQVIVGGSYPYLGGWADPQGSINNGWMTGTTPEVYDGGSWRSLFGANSRDAFGPDFNRFWYPRAWIAPNGRVFGISSEKMWTLDPAGNGSVTTLPFKEPQRNAGNAADAPNVGPASTAVMYEPGKILQVGGNSYSNGEGFLSSSRATVVDINGGTPAVNDTAAMNFGRAWANATVLPNGQVAVTGGSKWNDRGGGDVVLASEIWNPGTGRWSLGASGAVYRGYHSSAILLQNGALLLAGGGAPGPVNNQNAEIFYPPYLFATVNGKAALAPRPQIVSLNTTRLQYGQAMQFEFASQNGVAQVVLIGLSQTTHSFNFTQRRIPLGFTQADQTVTLQPPASGAVAPPGYYQLVALDRNGVPSPGVIVAMGNVAAPPQTATPIVGTPAGTGTGGTGTGGGTAGGGTGTGGTGTGGTGTGGTDTAGGTGGTDGVTLKAAHSGLCLAVPAGNNADGALVTQQPCTGGAEQTWRVRATAGGNAYVNAASGKCMDISLERAVANGSRIWQWACHGGTNQAWTSRAQNGGNALVTAAAANLCLDVYGVSTQAGAATVVWGCWGGGNQTFSITAASSGTSSGGTAGNTGGMPLRAAHSGLCLSVPTGNNNDGALVTQQPCTGRSEQMWRVRAVAGGSALVNAASGKCLDISLERAVANNSRIWQWGCHGGTNQAWTTRAQNGGNAFVTAAAANLCLDIAGASTQTGAAAIMWACHGGGNQTFATTQLTQ